MSPLSKRIALAELLGWKWYALPSLDGVPTTYRCLFRPDDPYKGNLIEIKSEDIHLFPACNEHFLLSQSRIPDFLEDMTSVQLAEHYLFPDETNATGDYQDELERVVLREWMAKRFHSPRAIFATPSHRVESILKIFNKWLND